VEKSLILALPLLLACSSSASLRSERIGEGGDGPIDTPTADSGGTVASAGTGGAASGAGGTNGVQAGAGGDDAGSAGDARQGGEWGMPETGGTGGEPAGGGGAEGGSSGAGGTGGVPPFSCPPIGDHEWTIYTVEPGRCIRAGDTTWTGQQICRELSVDDGSCDAKCSNYVTVKVGLFSDPVTIAVMPMAGAVLQGSFEFDDPDYQTWCYQAADGVRPQG
jgi:hypothetical protein